MKPIRVFIFIAALLLSAEIQSKPLTVDTVPEPLQPWVDWVLQDEASYPCPFLYNSFKEKRCAWPSQLQLDLSDNSANFSFWVKVFAESWIQLPGNLEYWPLNVQDARAPQGSTVIMERNGRPVIKLQPGVHDISGEILWDALPENLQIPEDTGLIQLTVKDKLIAFPSIKKGQLWIKGGELQQSDKKNIEDKLDLQVYRRIDDDIPLQILTRLEFQVSGQQREMKISLPLLKNFIPMRLRSPLPARIEPNGQLLIQLRPGRWQINLHTRHNGSVQQLILNAEDKNWPEQEIWVFSAHPELRLVEIENLSAVDAQLTNLPDAWKGLPAYRVKNGESMRFKVIRRGDPDPEPDRLSLNRTLWLDFDGGGYTVNDRIKGTMTRSWRLSALPETLLGKVSLDGKNQLITRLPDSQQKGVEVRRGQLDLSADSRISASIKTINALGWEQTFYKVRAALNLPPGWRLFAATGVDNVPDSWISQWTLLDLFLVLITSLAISRLWNVYWGIFALVTLALVWHESEAPRFIWLNILAAMSLLRVLPSGKLYTLIKFYRNACWLSLILILIPFIVNQVRTGLYPQLQMPWQRISVTPHIVEGKVKPLESPSLASVPQIMSDQGARMEKRLKRNLVPQSVMPSRLEQNKPNPRKAVNFDQIDPKASVQTGPGIPQWQWQRIDLSWNGPVDSGQQIRFWYLTPTVSMLLNFLRAIVISVLALLVFGVLKGNLNFRLKALFPLLTIFSLFSIPQEEAVAEFPNQELLKQLKSRLLQAPDCLPSCAQIEQMQLNITPQELRIELQIDVQEKVGLPLPGQSAQWFPRLITVNGEEAWPIYRSRDGILWINLGIGHYSVVLKGPTPPVNQFSLPLPLNPHRITTTTEGWILGGIHKNISPVGQLQLTRQKNDDPQNFESALEPGVLPPFVRVERTLQLGLDWRVKTRVIRVTPPGVAVVIQVPLIYGESVTTASVQVKNNAVMVNMPANQQAFQWHSTLEHTEEIKLEAPQTSHWTEVWRADISPIWHMNSDGLAVIHHQDKQGRWLPEWRPWPGESLSLSISRPQAVKGPTLTIDNSRLEITPGKRAQEARLRLSLRSSQGSQHKLILPELAKLQSVSLNGKSQPIRLQGRELTLPIKPGTQNIAINWRQAKVISTVFESPEVDLGVNSVNTTLRVNLARDRWTLLTSGPAFGPAVLFWGMLVVIAVFSYALGKIPLTPLKSWQWLLLLIGLSQVPVVAALFVVGWLMIVGYRGKSTLENRLYFNAMQIGIVLLTLIALGILFVAINHGLLGSPEMQISGNQSSAYQLNWYQDRSETSLPQARVISIPLTVYRILMLIWSLWLALSLLNWLKWGWGNFSREGLWKKANPKIANPETDSDIVDKK